MGSTFKGQKWKIGKSCADDVKHVTTEGLLQSFIGVNNAKQVSQTSKGLVRLG